MFGRRHVLVAAVTAFGLLGTGCAQVTSGTGAAVLGLVGFVHQGAQATMSQKSADVTMSGSLSAGGQDVTMSGNGQMDLAARTMKMTLHMTIAGQSADVNEIFVGGAIYMQVSVGGQSMTALAGGKPWGELKIPGGIQAGTSSTADPMQMLKLMTESGATVTPLGPTTIRGASAAGYSVTIPASVMVAQARKALDADPSVSADERTQILQALQGMAPMVLDVWFDPAKHLLERMRAKIGMNLGAMTMSGLMTFDFTNYGVPVTIAAPPANDVAPLSGTH